MAEKHESRAKTVLGGSHKSEKKNSSHKAGEHPHEIHVRSGHSGGFIAKHIHKHKMGEEPREPEEHVLADKDQMLQHMDENTPDERAAPAEGAAQPVAEPGGAATPSPAAGV